MASKYWIKLYHEIIHDPKMCRLSDRLYRRCIELFLIAGETDDEGFLPNVDDIAWTLRMGKDDLETDMADLASHGILHKDSGRWIVTNFGKRQAPVEAAERMRRMRERKQKRQYYEEVTDSVTKGVTYRNVDTESDTDKNQNREELPRFLTPMQAVDIFSRVTGMVAIPNSVDRPRDRTLEDIYDIRGMYSDIDSMVADGKKYYSAWIKRNYTKTNTAWIDWWIAKQIPNNSNGTVKINTAKGLQG